jgi:hypothetical protein
MLETVLIGLGLKAAAPAFGSAAWFALAASTATGKTILTATGIYGTHVGVQGWRLMKKVDQAQAVIDEKQVQEELLNKAQADVDAAETVARARRMEASRVRREAREAIKAVRDEEKAKLKASGQGIKWFPKFGKKAEKITATSETTEEPKPATKKAAKTAAKPAAASA